MTSSMTVTEVAGPEHIPPKLEDLAISREDHKHTHMSCGGKLRVNPSFGLIFSPSFFLIFPSPFFWHLTISLNLLPHSVLDHSIATAPWRQILSKSHH